MAPVSSIPDPVDRAILSLAEGHLSGRGVVAAPSAAVAGALSRAGRRVATGPLEALPGGAADAVALLADELSHAGEAGAEALLAGAARVLRPGGQLLVTALNRVYASATGHHLNGARGYSAAELSSLLGQRGFHGELLCAPGAASGLGTSSSPSGGGLHPDLDRHPGLLDAAPRLLALARAPRDRAARSRTFFASLPRKVVAAAVVCRDADGRLLVVHDSFKQHWTIPGGVVDADENPVDAAAREAWEEAGVRVAVGPLLGVFTAAWPDRVVMVYGADPVAPVAGSQPVHDHEIDEVRWLEVDDALTLLAPHVADQVRHCLGEPGGTWTLGRA